MTQKNPYELRYDVLVMAKQMADRHYDTQAHLAWQAAEMYKDNVEKALEAWEKYIPKAISPDEIRKNAENLYTFIMNKDSVKEQ
jgi:methionine synthase II (cobalamin-independent)